jgi:hypothetical protein
LLVAKHLGRTARAFLMTAFLLAPACGRIGYDTEGATADPQDGGALPITTFDGSVQGLSCADLPRGSPSGTYTFKSGSKTSRAYCDTMGGGNNKGHGPGYPSGPFYRQSP